MTPVSSLYAITQRLNLTPTAELPHIASFLVSSIHSSSDALSRPQIPDNAKGNDDAVLVHKLKTRLSSLLQDHSLHAQWTAVIIIKAVVEAGGWHILHGCASWLRSIASILGRPTTQIIKRPCFVTATRIFSLAQQYPTLVRELANPILPSFISICIDQAWKSLAFKEHDTAKGRDENLTDLLQSFSQLVPKYPSLFRPFRVKVWAIASHCLGSVAVTHPAHAAARVTLIHLHQCAPKLAVEGEWVHLFELTVSAIHGTLDQLFRSVHEDWVRQDQKGNQTSGTQNYAEDVCGDFKEALKLPAWRGINQGTERVESLISLLQSLFDTPSSTSVPIPIGLVGGVIDRLSSLTVPSSDKALQKQVRLNQEATRLEREELFAALPRIHVYSLRLLISMLTTLEAGLIPIVQIFFEQVLWIFSAEKDIPDVRAECYNFLSTSLYFTAQSWSVSDVSEIADLIHYCCHDIEPVIDRSPSRQERRLKTNDGQDTSTSVNADAFLATPAQRARVQEGKRSKVEHAAAHLLTRLLTNVPSSAIPESLRAELDCTALLSQQREAMLASVLNPMPVIRGKVSMQSILPFFARECGDHLLAEGVLRPRMPPVPNLQQEENEIAETEYRDLLQGQPSRDPEGFHAEFTGSHTDNNASSQEVDESFHNSAFQDVDSSEIIPRPLSAANPTSNLDHSHDVQSDRGSKRDWLTINAPMKYGDVTSTLGGGEHTSKKPRLSEASNPHSPPIDDSNSSSLRNIQSRTLSSMEKSNNTIKNVSLSPTPNSVDNVIHNPSATHVLRDHEDDGESDFEMPTIDPTMDSEDEEYGDVDDDDGNDP